MSYTFHKMFPRIRWRVLLAILKDAWAVWLSLFGFAVAVIIGCWLSATAPSAVRYTGTLLQVFGLATVALGLSRMRRSFDRPSFFDGVRAWLRQVTAAFAKPRTIAAQATATGRARASIEARVIRGVRPGAPLEERVLLLEKDLGRLRDELDDKDRQLRREVASVRESIERESESRQTQIQRTTHKIEEVAVGGLHLESVGLLWLVVGVLGTSIPNEIASRLLSVFEWASRFLGSGVLFTILY